MYHVLKISIKYSIFQNLQLNNISLWLLGTKAIERMASFNERALKSLSSVVTSNMINMAHRNVEVSVIITTCIDYQNSSCTLQTQFFQLLDYLYMVMGSTIAYITWGFWLRHKNNLFFRVRYFKWVLKIKTGYDYYVFK